MLKIQRHFSLLNPVKTFAGQIAILFLTLFSSAAYSQISGTRTVGFGENYATLTAAFADITTNTLNGNMTLVLTSNYDASVETYPIVPSPSAAVDVNTITIYPNASGLQIGIGAGSPTGIINFSDAKNIIIDGRVNATGSVRDLVIYNNNTASTASTISISNGSTNNIIRYCNLQGASSSNTNGVISFGLASGAPLGNNNNTITNCFITSSGGGLTCNGIYSAGTVGTPNTGNTISDNRIYDFFLANATSIGINLQANNDAWTVTGNSIYQTATRTVTGNSTHYGIHINSSTGNNFTVSNNFIGGSTVNAGGTPWTLTSGLAGTFVGIRCTVGTTTTSSIQNNTIANFLQSGAAVANPIWAGIQIAAGTVNVGTVTGNTIGSTTGPGSIDVTCSTTGTLVYGIQSSATGIVNIQNNNIAGITTKGSSTAVAVGYTGILVSAGTPTISNNTIGSTTIPNSMHAATAITTGTQQCRGIDVTSGVTVATTISNNTVANLTQEGVNTTTTLRGITFGGTSLPTITGNTIFNLTSSTSSTATQPASVAGLVSFATSGTTSTLATISQNTVYAIRNINSGAVSTTVNGMALTNSNAATVTRNKIYDITNASTGTSTTAPPMAVGILYLASGAPYVMANNMVTLGEGQTTNTMFVGVWCNFNSAGNATLLHNTIRIAGTAASGALPTYIFFRGTPTGTVVTTAVNIKNNIFQNVRTGGTGKHYIYANLNASPGTGWGPGLSDYNALNSNAATVGIWNTTDLTFANWKSTTSNDASSIHNVTLNFVNPTIGDLHLNFGNTPNQLESSGAGTGVTGITTDYDNDARPGPVGSVNGGAVAPDLGADEIDGVIQDLTPPTIAYTLITNTSTTTNRTLNLFATITDLNGVNFANGTRPRIYYKRSTDANTFNDNTSSTDGWKWVQSNNTTSPFSFTIDYALLNGGTGVTGGDVIQYFVNAQDFAPGSPNVGINSGIYAVTPSSVALTSAAFPITGTINSYSITPSYSGTINVGTGETFTSLTNAGGLFEALNNGALTGNLTVNITSDLTAETATFALNQLAEDGVGGYTVTIKPSGVARTISGSSTFGLIKINGADRIVFDGSLSGGTDRSLTVFNTSTTGTNAVFHMASASSTDGATYNTIKNCIIKGTGQTTVVGIASANTSGTTSTAASPNSNNTYQNNEISAVLYGLLLAAPAATDANTIVTGNYFGSSITANKMGWAAIYGWGHTNITISNNTISGVTLATASTTTAVSGILLGGATTNSFIINNKISDVKNTSTGGAIGINLKAFSASGNNLVANNQVADVSSGGTNATPTEFNNAAGIFVSSGGYKIYHNSVNMNTNQSAGTSAAIHIAAAITGANSMDIRNNVFATAQTTNTRYAIYSAAAATVYSDINYNDYFTTAGGILGFLGSNQTTLAAWQGATGKDANSINANPLFNTPTNLAPLSGSPVLGAGTSVGITTDILGLARSGSTPSIGAYENAGDFAAPAITYTLLPNTCSTGDITLTANITDNTGVNINPTFRPRIYFRKNAGSYFSTTGVQTQGSALNGTWSFTINAAAMGGLTQGDVVSYFVIAQDVSINQNVGSTPAGVVATNVNTVTTPPSANTYTVQGPLAPGTYTVGSGGNYATLTAAIAAYNTSCLSGPVVFSLTASTYSTGTGETMPLEILANPTASATNTLTIKPATGVTATITGSTGDIWVFDGADYVTVDGSNNGSTSRNLTVSSTNTTSGTDVFWIASSGAGEGCRNVTIKNTIIQGGTKGTGSAATTVVTQWGMYVGSITGAAAGPDNDYLTIENNQFLRSTIALQAQSNATGPLDNLIIRNNIFGDATTDANSIGRTAISVNYATNSEISGNTIQNVNITDNGNPTGILVGTDFLNSVISKNIITNVRYAGTGGYGAKGIDINTANAASNLVVSNNMISSIRGDGWSSLTGDGIVGLRLLGTTGGVKLYYNSVSLGSGSFAGNASGILSAAVYFASTVTDMDVRNNIFYTNLQNTNGSAAPNAKTYAIYSDAPNTAFTNINYNNYASSGTQGVAGFIGSARTTLAAIQAGFGSNTNSVSFVPVFTSTTDLHLTASGNCGLESKGQGITGYSTDIDGNARHANFPDVGADEFTATDNQWLGTVSNNWQTTANWCSGLVPTSATDVTIPAGTPYHPKLTYQAFVNNLTMAAGTRLTLANYVFTIGGSISGTGVFSGSRYSKLIFTGSGSLGTLYMKSDSTSLQNLFLTGTGATLTLGSATSVLTKLDVGPNTLASGGFLTIKSDINGTAAVAEMTGSITGNVTVERYIPKNAFRAWRLLSVPVQGSATFHTAWQENQAPMANGVPGYGTLLTSAAGGNGYDAQTAGNSLLQFTNGNPGTWSAVSSTNNSMQTNAGYMVFIRGDRSVGIQPGNFDPGATTLRATGTLYQGTQPVINAPAGQNVLVGNVYAAAIDFNDMVKSGITAFKVWDPKLQGTNNLGGYQTFSSVNGYDPTPGGGSYGSTPNSRIESGQAFFVSSPSGGSIQLTEAAKTNGSRNVFRGSRVIQQFKAKLYAVTSTGEQLADGNTVVFGTDFINGIDNADVEKISNFGENLGINSNGSTLVIEGRSNITSEDVIQYNVTGLKQQQYILELSSQNMNGSITAFVEDKFLGTNTQFDLSVDQRITFTVTDNPASSAKDRFRVVFKKNVPLTVVDELKKDNFVITPNPVTDGRVNVKFENQPSGSYTVRVFNQSGQVIHSQQMMHAGGSNSYALRLNSASVTGVYRVEILKPSNQRYTNSIVINSK